MQKKLTALLILSISLIAFSDDDDEYRGQCTYMCGCPAGSEMFDKNLNLKDPTNTMMNPGSYVGHFENCSSFKLNLLGKNCTPGNDCPPENQTPCTLRGTNEKRDCVAIKLPGDEEPFPTPSAETSPDEMKPKEMKIEKHKKPKKKK